jgi:hypothetical protein
MAQLSTTPEDWNERAALFNYCCRGCRNRITFEDQNLYFVQGYCKACFDGREEKRFGPGSDTAKRLEQIRSRQGH